MYMYVKMCCIQLATMYTAQCAVGCIMLDIHTSKYTYTHIHWARIAGRTETIDILFDKIDFDRGTHLLKAGYVYW